jgi:hypothetical protein
MNHKKITLTVNQTNKLEINNQLKIKIEYNTIKFYKTIPTKLKHSTLNEQIKKCKTRNEQFEQNNQRIKNETHPLNIERIETQTHNTTIPVNHHKHVKRINLPT